MDNNTLFLLIYIVVGVMIAGAIWAIVSSFLPWMTRRRAREKPRDALQKLLTDFKLSAKSNREAIIKFVRFQGDKSVYRARRYKVRGIIADPRCYVFGLKLRRLSLTSVLLCPPELCSFLNSREVAIRARGIQRWNNLFWFPVLTEGDIPEIKRFEGMIQKYLDYSTIQMGRIEAGELFFDNWYEAADGSEYQSFVERSERVQGVTTPKAEIPQEEQI